MTPGAAVYCGRFAPTPSGPLHTGSLLAAVASFLDARRSNGRWLVRIDDLDAPRVVPGSAAAILRALEVFGLAPDAAIVHQSQRGAAYSAALARLSEQRLVYPCSCTRAEIAALTGSGRSGAELRYPGRCRAKPMHPTRAHAWRLRVGDEPVEFLDQVQGPSVTSVAATVGDFIVRRRDGPFAYQLAVVVDDDAAGVTHVVRGADLIDNTARQILLQRALGLRVPNYAHIPVLVDGGGRKLSKSTHAAALELDRPGETLWQTLALLRQEPPRSLRGAPPRELLAWGAEHWSLARLRGCTRIRLTGAAA